jgi:hypothetical protein
MKRTTGRFNISLGFLYLALILAGILGWIMNLVAVIHAIGGPLDAELVIRIVGLFLFPLGAIMGYIS